ncbi:hypothetical protein ABEX78_23535 [Priestia megaterium]
MQGEMFFPEIEVQSNEKVEAQATWIAKWLQNEYMLMEEKEFKNMYDNSSKIRELQQKVNKKKIAYSRKALKDFPEPVSELVTQKLGLTSELSFRTIL